MEEGFSLHVEPQRKLFAMYVGGNHLGDSYELHLGHRAENDKNGYGMIPQHNHA